MDNPERGEFALILEDERFVLRPSFEAIVAFEQETGKGLLDLTRSAIGGTATLSEIAIIATHCIRAWGRENDLTSAAGVNAQRVGRLIMESEQGLTGATVMIGTLLALAVNGGLTAAGEVKAASTTSPTTGLPSGAA